MKKAIIVTLIIFIIASLVTVFSAATLGAGALKQIVESIEDGTFSEKLENSGIVDVIDEIENGFDYDDGSPAFNSDLLQGRDFDIIGIPDYQISGDRATEIDISEKQELTVHADVARVVIKSTTDKTMTVTANVYSAKKDVVTGGYEMILFDKGYDVYLKSDKNLKDAVGELTLEIPESYKGKVTVTVGVGELVIRDAKLETLDAGVDVGEISAESAAVNAAVLTVDTGEIEIGKGFNCFTSLNVKNQIGSVEYDLPEGRIVDINYSVKTGAAQTDGLEDAGFTVTGTAETGLDGITSTGRITGSYGDTAVSAVMNVTVEVGIGNIEFDVK